MGHFFSISLKVKKSLYSLITFDQIKLQPKSNLHIPMVQTHLRDGISHSSIIVALGP